MADEKTEGARGEMTPEQKRFYNAGYVKGGRDTIKLFTDLGVSLSADILNIERQLLGEVKPEETEEKTDEKQPVEG